MSRSSSRFARVRNLLLTGLAFLSGAVAQAQTPSPPDTYILAGHLLDRPGKPPRDASTIIVRSGKIAEVRHGFVTAPAGAQVVDLRDRFVLPGLIDLHVHLMGIAGDPMRSRLAAISEDDADDLIYGVANARRVLAAGFTTVRDLGANPRSIRALRDGIDRGDVEGPTIVNAGSMISVTGGHADYSNGLREVFWDGYHAHQINTCDGPEDCRRAVRQQVALGAQVIKFAATGGVLSNVAGGLGRAMTPAEMSAIVETAHALGRRVAAHSHALEGTKAALAAGVDTIEHGSFLDEATVREMKAKGVYLVPTELAITTSVEQARSGALPAPVLPKAEAAAAAAMASHRLAIAAGVKIGFGTDTGVSKFGENAREFALLVRDGLSPDQAIAAATTVAAAALGRESSLGLIAPGYDADIVAVRGDPLADVTRLEHVTFVMRRGEMHDAAEK